MIDLKEKKQQRDSNKANLLRNVKIAVLSLLNFVFLGPGLYIFFHDDSFFLVLEGILNKLFGHYVFGLFLMHFRKVVIISKHSHNQ